MTLKNQIDLKKLPTHIAIIMDGNGRWAKQQGKRRIFGHQKGTEAVREAVEACAELGVKYLTLYAFSTENWLRPKMEVSALMELLVKSLSKELKTLMQNKIALHAIGDIESLPKGVQRKLQEVIDQTSANKHMTLVLALSYSSRWEMSNALKLMMKDFESGKLKTDKMNEEMISQYLTTKNIPDPELLIRTSGEHRLSNFLLWQCAYTELYFTDVLWPDFNKDELCRAIIDFQSRERRFGKTSEQIKN